MAQEKKSKKADVKDAKVSETKSKKGTSSAKKTTKQPVKKSSTRKKETTIVQEENHYGKTLLAGLIIIVALVGVFFAYKNKDNDNKDNNKVVLTADEKKFKEEYESLNGTTKSNGTTVTDVEIIKDNNIEYITIDEAADILDSGSGLIYFGFAACPWCRNAVPELLTAMSNSNLDKIYYVNVRPGDDAEQDIRDLYTLNDRNKARKTKDASQSYYDILLSLANELSDYVLVTEKGKKVNTGEKRLYAPTVVAVLNGEIVGFHEGTVDNHEKDENGDLRALTKAEKEKLRTEYTKIISSYLNDDCGENAEGC